MVLEWTGTEHVLAPIDRVWTFIADPNMISGCMPDLVSATIESANLFDAVVKVGVGPVRGNFKFKIALDPHPDGGKMNMTISGGGLGSVVDLNAEADVKDNGDGTTMLDWRGSASMRGPIATVGGRVIDAQAKKVIGLTFENVRLQLSGAPA